MLLRKIQRLLLAHFYEFCKYETNHIFTIKHIITMAYKIKFHCHFSCLLTHFFIVVKICNKISDYLLMF